MMAMTQESAAREEKLRVEREEKERENDRIRVELETKLDEKSRVNDEAGEKIRGLESEREALKEAMNSKEFAHSAQSAEEIARLRGEVEVMKEKLANADLKAAAFGEKTAGDVKELERQLVALKAERRKMHNVIQELRGNVRVMARIRPFLPNDNAQEGETPCVNQSGDYALKISVPDKEEHKFSYDKVFAPSASQETVFKEVSEFVQSALDGYNVCLFSYGQTGSGKTHTMQGSGSGQMRGIIPRAIQQIAEYKTVLEKDGWKYKIQVTYIEIYNEQIKDLLAEEPPQGKHEIKTDGNGRRYISHVVEKDLDPNDADQIEDLMRTAAKARSVASTDMNAVSSRSHSVFALELTAVNAKLKQSLKGKLSLVDLAGSERLEKSGATGQRQKEACNINASLSCLTTVFNSIGKKSSHIPFRDSKLTYMLQECLSGNGKTLMMINLSPTCVSFSESLSTMRFGASVRRVELGKAKASIEDSDHPKAREGAKAKEAASTARETKARARSVLARPATARSAVNSPAARGRSSSAINSPARSVRSKSSPSKLKAIQKRSQAVARNGL